MSRTAPRAGAEHGPRRAVHAVVALAAALGTGACAERRAPAGEVTLWLGGDVHLGDGEPPAAAAGRDPRELEADRRLAALSSATAGALGVINLEGPVLARGAREGELFNHPARLAGLRRAGVLAVGLANNHAGDAGDAGPLATATALRLAGLAPVGGPAGATLVERAGVRVAITAHDLVPADDAAPGELAPGLTAEAVAAELTAARASADVLVATFHVTTPPSYLPPREALTAAALARAAGASVIAFHGSHALARVERLGGTVTAYGLGNLLFTCACTDVEDALILRVTLDRAGLRDAEVIPVAAGLDGAPARLSDDPAIDLQLLRGLRSTPLEPAGARARL